MLKTYGIHHISSTVGNAQRNIDFNSAVLGLRLLKQTLNYDDSAFYHFYFGNHEGSTGLTTTFPSEALPQGKIGAGQVAATIYNVSQGKLGFWFERLEKFNLKAHYSERLGTETIKFNDPDGLEFEIVEFADDSQNNWEFNGIEKENALLGIHGAVLFSHRPEVTLKLFTKVLGYKIEAEGDEFTKLKIHDKLGGEIYLNKNKIPKGRRGVGTVHHIALTLKNDEIEAWQKYLVEAGYKPTDIKDRKYFRSIYFREQGGILIELATQGPGVFIDESEDELGSKLIIPEHYKKDHLEIKNRLSPVEVREVNQI